jgi:hypothetical protein
LRSRWSLAVLLLCLPLTIGCPKKSPEMPGPPTSEPAAEEPDGPPLFEDVTAASGIDFTYRNGEETANHFAILESLGGGVALIDYDGDGLLDIFLTGGGHYAGADKTQIKGHPCKLYKNLGNFRFRDVTQEVGLDKIDFYTHGAAVADYDKDGWPDLLVTGWGAVALFHNVPVDPADPKKGRRFEDVTAAAGLGQGITWATSAAFADLDGDGYPDLYVCQYVNWSLQNNPQCAYGGEKRDVCPPRQFQGLPHKLYRNTGRGTFLDVSREAGLMPGGADQSKGLGVLVVDVDGDGKPDIYVTNDTVDKFLYLNRSTRGQLRFDERGLSSGASRDDLGTPDGSMGVDAGDPYRSGKPSLWVTNYENELHALYRNDSQPGHPLFRFRSTASGIAALGKGYVGWGTSFLDADLDGWEDLFVVHGHAIRYPTGKSSQRKQLPALLLNTQGKFLVANNRIGDYARTPHLGRGVGFGDLDNDGRIDLVISHVNEPVTILRGIGGRENHWLGVSLAGKDHSCVVGARAVFTTNGQSQTRFVKGGGSYLSSGDRRLVFGLGSETTGRLKVTWPDGSEQSFDDLAIDRYHRIVQGRPADEADGSAGG